VRRRQERFARYLRATAVCDPAVFSPWALADRLADELLETLLADVARDLWHGCGAAVDQLLDDELAPP